MSNSWIAQGEPDLHDLVAVDASRLAGVEVDQLVVPSTLLALHRLNPRMQRGDAALGQSDVGIRAAADGEGTVVERSVERLAAVQDLKRQHGLS